MAEIVETDGAVSLVAPPLRLAFAWDGRRWSHRLFFGDRPLAASVEADAEGGDPDRVVSPAYQQLSTQTTAAGPQALLVGQWGRHHFSAVFQAAEDASGARVEVDVAARSRPGLAALAGTYLVDLTSSHLRSADPASVAWALDDPPDGRLWFEAGGRDDRVALAEAGRRATRVQASAVIDPGAPAPSPTFRLRYRWRASPAIPPS